ncbi:MAG: hypothetical protein K9L23_18915 [Desulfotignum sp.]|nr:hypothetical protein [Desulfotignum sp.]
MKPSEKYRLDERNHVEKPLLDQLSGLGWEIIDLNEEKQTSGHTFRDNLTAFPRTFRFNPMGRCLGQ